MGKERGEDMEEKDGGDRKEVEGPRLSRTEEFGRRNLKDEFKKNIV